MKTVLPILLLLAASPVLRAQTNASPRPAPAPQWRIVQQQSFDMFQGRVRRLDVRIRVPPSAGTAAVDRAIGEVLAAVRADRHAVSISVDRDGDAVAQGYTVAMGTWAPDGDWGRAMDGLDDPQRRTYRLVIEHNDREAARRALGLYRAKEKD